MMKKIIDKVEITPEEVRSFFKKIPQNELPVLVQKWRLPRIVIKPKVTEAEKQKVIDRLKSIRADVLVSFR